MVILRSFGRLQTFEIKKFQNAVPVEMSADKRFSRLLVVAPINAGWRFLCLDSPGFWFLARLHFRHLSFVVCLSSVNWSFSETAAWIQTKFYGRLPPYIQPFIIIIVFFSKFFNIQIFTIFFGFRWHGTLREQKDYFYSVSPIWTKLYAKLGGHGEYNVINLLAICKNKLKIWWHLMAGEPGPSSQVLSPQSNPGASPGWRIGEWPLVKGWPATLAGRGP